MPDSKRLAAVRERTWEQVGDVPQPARMGEVMDTEYGPAREIDRRRSAQSHNQRTVNLAPVAEVLLRYGLDPAEELARLLAERVPVLDSSGNPVLDADGKPMLRTMLSPADHGKLAAELLQYTRPKLKATEITVKPAELTDDQIDRRLEMLLAKQGPSGE